MTRLRTKGGASPEALYELTNAYVTASKTIEPRPCLNYITRVPTGSKGLFAFKGILYSFVASNTVVNNGSTTLLVLRHPSPFFGGTLRTIHFTQPFMGFPYVVAEFSDGNVYHYWLQNPAPWKRYTIYKANDLVQPTVPNGLYYQAVQTVSAAPAWTAGLQHMRGDIVQPTTYNGFQYQAIIMNGDIFDSGPAASGAVEPIWPTSNGQTVLESSAGAATPVNPAPEPPPATPPGGGPGGRYSNPGGSGLGLGNRNRTFIL